MTDSRKVVVVVELEREEAEAYADDYVSQDDPRIHDALEAVDKIQAAIRRALESPVEAVWMCPSGGRYGPQDHGNWPDDALCFSCGAAKDQHRRVYVIKAKTCERCAGTRTDHPKHTCGQAE